MYKSPISIYETAMNTIIEQRENAIFAKVQDAFDVQVDKDELIRALQYDRGQYEKGYADAQANLVLCRNCKHLMFSDCYGECNKFVRIVRPDDFCSWGERKDNGN